MSFVTVRQGKVKVIVYYPVLYITPDPPHVWQVFAHSRNIYIVIRIHVFPFNLRILFYHYNGQRGF